MSNPLDPLPQHRQGLRFLGGAIGLMIVNPVRLGRQTHKNGFCPAISLKAELCAAVPHKIELDVSSTAQILPLFLLIAERQSMVLCHQMCVNRSERVSHTFDKIKTRLLRKSVFTFEVIEEDENRRPITE